MAESKSNVPVRTEMAERTPAEPWRPFESLRQEMARLFDDFELGLRRFPFRRSTFETEPFWRSGFTWGGAPAVDIMEREDDYKITVELPGMDEKNIEVKVANGDLTITGEKQEEKEEKKKDYHMQERRFGSFERRFSLPEGIDADRIGASFRSGVLTVTLPKKPEARKAEKKIEVKSA